MTISFTIRRVAASAATAVALSLGAFAAAPAQAQTAPSAIAGGGTALAAAASTATAHAALVAPVSASASQLGASRLAPTAVTPDVSFGCGSTPTFVSSNDGTFTAQGVKIHSGPYTSCTTYGLGYEGNTLKVWCYVINNNGVIWLYLNDRTTGVRGWSEAQYVTGSGSVPYCT